jgi:Putative metal-binding motif
MTSFTPPQRHTRWHSIGSGTLLALSLAASGACGSGAGSSSAGGGQGGAAGSSVDSVGSGFSTGTTWGSGTFLGCMSSQDCWDGKPCTLDVCDIPSGTCSNPVDPCLAGQYCDLVVGCVDVIACATTEDCETAWAGDACKTNIACEPATSLCTFTPFDADNDGYPSAECGGEDCDDDNAERFPGNAEICDGQDNDCSNGEGKEDSPACTLVQSVGEYAMDSVAVDATSVYWTSSSSYGPGTGAVMKLPIGGGNPITLASEQDTWGRLAVDATSVYWTTYALYGDHSGAVMKVPIDGGNPTTLASGQIDPSGVAVDATNVYWVVNDEADDGTVSSALRKVPVGGGNPTTLASGPGYFIDIAVDATSVYWTSNGGLVRKVPIDGGSSITLAAGQDKPTALALDATNVYWINYGDSNGNAIGVGKVMKLPIGGGNPITLASGQYFPANIAVDGTAVYWTSDSVMKVPIGGGNPTTIASLEQDTGAHDIAVDATSVYWTKNWKLEFRPK